MKQVRSVLLLVLCVIVCWLSCYASAQVAAKNETFSGDVEALVGLTLGWKENTMILSELWNFTSGRFTSDPCYPKPWAGIGCTLNNETGFFLVTEIKLNNASLTGNLPTQLHNLTSLQTISFRHNNLTGLPSNYNFTTWPLTALVLRGNLFTGTAPVVPSSLMSLDLSHNNFYGPIPDDWFNGNQFSSLAELYLSNNQFVKVLPQPVASNIQFLDISSNNFYGEMPSINSTTMPAILIMHLNDNHFSSGHSNISNLPKLSILTLSGNPVKAIDIFFLSTFPSLYQFSCSSCQLTGNLPSLPNRISILDLRSNSLTGTLPYNWGGSNMTLMWIYLANNQLTGPIPSTWGSLVPYLKELDVSYNRLSGPMPSWLQESPTGKFTFNSRCNNFSGELPQWCKDTQDCVACSSGDGEEDTHREYLWFLLVPGLLMCGLFFAVIGFFVYRHRSRVGYEELSDKL